MKPRNVMDVVDAALAVSLPVAVAGLLIRVAPGDTNHQECIDQHVATQYAEDLAKRKELVDQVMIRVEARCAALMDEVAGPDMKYDKSGRITKVNSDGSKISCKCDVTDEEMECSVVDVAANGEASRSVSVSENSERNIHAYANDGFANDFAYLDRGDDQSTWMRIRELDQSLKAIVPEREAEKTHLADEAAVVAHMADLLKHCTAVENKPGVTPVFYNFGTTDAHAGFQYVLGGSDLTIKQDECGCEGHRGEIEDRLECTYQENRGLENPAPAITITMTKHDGTVTVVSYDDFAANGIQNTGIVSGTKAKEVTRGLTALFNHLGDQVTKIK